MKKIGLFLALAMFFAGCGGDDGWSTSDYCSYNYQQDLDKNFNFSSLSDEQRDQLKTIYLDTCASYVDGLPYCKSELLDDAECWSAYSDEDIKQHESEWNAIERDCQNNAKDDKGVVDNDKYYDCMYEKNYPCAKSLKASNICESDNKNILENYNDQFNKDGGIRGKLTQKFQFWGLNINDYLK